MFCSSFDTGFLSFSHTEGGAQKGSTPLKGDTTSFSLSQGGGERLKYFEPTISHFALRSHHLMTIPKRLACHDGHELTELIGRKL